jgi:hypothetical protein
MDTDTKDPEIGNCHLCESVSICGRDFGVQASACVTKRGSQNFTRRARSLKAELQHPRVSA